MRVQVAPVTHYFAPIAHPRRYTCKAYCETLAKHCTGIQQEYISNSVCEAMCSHFEPGRPGEQTNDSLACRVFHANEAAKNPDEPGCRTACAGFPYLIAGDAGDASGPVGDIVFSSGLESAYEVGNPQAPTTHCPHTAVQSATCN